MKKISFRFETKIISISGVLTFVLLVGLYMFKGLAPFGTKSLAVMDANIQYLDFFSYYKDVLSGKNSILYTFSKTLGGSCIAVFSYYLSSPFNLLLIFFSNQQLHTFFDLVVALKLSLASSAFAYFCVNRFPRSNNEQAYTYILISIGYGLCQYNIAQCSNIMWLDGVYMLPFLLLQVYYIVHGKKTWHLSFLVGATILFNWYSAGIDCIFTGFWFLFELFMLMVDKKLSIKEFLSAIFHYIASMILGVLLSSILFLPTIGALQKSSRSSLIWNELKNFSFLGNVFTTFNKYTYGSLNELGSVALFCGSLPITLAISIFCNNKISYLKRILLGILFSGTILLFYWNPLYVLFSLLQWVTSYNYRYSYIGIFVILFLAIYNSRELTDKKNLCRFAFSCVLYSALLIMVSYVKHPSSQSYIIATAIFIILTSALYILTRLTSTSSDIKRIILSIILISTVSIDLLINASLLLNKYSKDYVTDYQSYRATQESLISSIKSHDDSWYRISQTATREMNEKNLTAHYNEPLSYNYASISGYTSSPDDIQRTFLNNLGYPINGENMCITNTSILGADSLLGVKYILSPYYINGLENNIVSENMPKSIYTNPYAFPLAFVYNENEHIDKNMVAQNPFEYQNLLYKTIFGISDNLYLPLENNVVCDYESNTIKIIVQVPESNEFTVYGSIPWNSQMGASVYINNKFITDYACWLSPTVFYVPTTNDNICEVEVDANSLDFDMNSIQFYALNLDLLKECSQIANNNIPDTYLIKNGYVSMDVLNTRGNQKLFIAIPADSDWTITLNGLPAHFELLGDCLYSIDLNNGNNHLEMVYHVKYLRIGIIISIFTFIFLSACSIYKKYKTR